MFDSTSIQVQPGRPARPRAAIFALCTILAMTGNTRASAQCTGVWTGSPGPAPSARNYHAMAYDAARGRTVLFGGQNAGGNLADTWEWDGSAWALVATTGPAARSLHAMTYDSVRGKVVLFGGFGFSFRRDTWEWDGVAWVQKSNTGPTARFLPGLAFDAVRGKVVLFGGFDGLSKADTWEWNGTTWTQVIAPGPSARYALPLAFDEARSRIVLFGGLEAGTTPRGDTWEFNGTSWVLVCGSGPSPRYGHMMCFDSLRGRMMVFGGTDGVPKNDTWEANGAIWNWVTSSGPTARYSGAVAFDIDRQEAFLFGGTPGTGFLGDAWRYKGPGPPTIINSPLGVAVNVGQMASFTASATGNGPFSWQWRANGVNLANVGPYSGVNTHTLTINPITMAEVAAYDCVVANSCGSVRSNPAAPQVIPCVGDLNGDLLIDGQDTQILVDMMLLTNGVCP
ncbi:MAG TPA: kelch repeat-containing protein [Phycisphaerae bacterium]|nr:kelch repeat-containing protein [Phycisphaerae bacterium]